MGISIGLGIAAVLVLAIIFYIIATYNRLVSTREFVRNGMGQIAAQIESRWDGVKSLIDATKKYSEHEATVLAETTAARTRLSTNSSVKDVEADDAQFASVLGRINVVAENYPELKASGVYQDAMDHITKFENNVRHSRMFFNDSVTKHNRLVQSFPSNIVASMFSFTISDYFRNTATKADMPSW